MAPIGLAAAEPQAIVGRLVAGNPSDGTTISLDCPVQVKRDGEDSAIAVDAKGVSRRGKPADVRSGIHWMLTKAPGGGFALRRVRGWYEFEKPSAAPTTILVGRSQGKDHDVAGASSIKKLPQNVQVPSAEAELKIEANKRKEWADRWDKMQGRREGRVGVRVKFGDIVKEKTDKTEVPKRKIEHPEEQRLNDETGISKQKKKKAKQLRKEANAVDQAEEDDVPETANALLSLKHERGEAGWDFSDEEAFSDDEQEKEQFEGGPTAGTEDVEEAAPSGDEDEGEDAEKGDLLSSHGKQIEVLIDNFAEDEIEGAEGAGDLSGDEDAPEDEDAPDNEVASKAEVVDSKRRRLMQEHPEAAAAPAAPEASSASSGPTAPAPAAPVAPTAAAAQQAPASRESASSSTARAAARAGTLPSSRAPEPVAPKQPAKSSAHSAPVAASSSAAPPTSAAAAAAPDSAKAKLREETIQCLRQQGGSCTLKQLTAVMNLKNTKSDRYKNVTLILKEVAALKMDPATNKPVLKLLPEHRK